MAKKEIDPIPPRSPVVVKWHRNQWVDGERKGSLTAEITLEQVIDIDPLVDPLAFRVQVRKLYRVLQDCVDEQIEEHSDVYTKCVPLLNATATVEQVEKLAGLVADRITEGKVKRWEVEELQALVNERRILLTDLTEFLLKPVQAVPVETQGELL